MPPSLRVAWIDIARGASILLVIIYHATLFTDSFGLGNPAWDLFNGATQPLRMPLFFFLSGMLASRAVARGWRELLPGRLGTNLYLYLVWATAAFLLFSCIPYERQGAPRGAQHWVTSTLLLPENGLWYLLLLAVFTAVVKVLRPVPTGLLLAGAAMVSAIACTEPVKASFVWNNALLLFAFFAAGLRLPSAAGGLSQLAGRPRVALPLVVVVGSAALLAAHSGWMQLFGVRTVLGVAAVTAGVAAAAALTGTTTGRLLASLGRNTLPVYVTHEMVLAVLSLPLVPAASTALGEALRWIAPAVLTVAAATLTIVARGPLGRVRGLLSPPWVPAPAGTGAVAPANRP